MFYKGFTIQSLFIHFLITSKPQVLLSVLHNTDQLITLAEKMVFTPRPVHSSKVSTNKILRSHQRYHITMIQCSWPANTSSLWLTGKPEVVYAVYWQSVGIEKDPLPSWVPVWHYTYVLAFEEQLLMICMWRFSKHPVNINADKRFKNLVSVCFQNIL